MYSTLSYYATIFHQDFLAYTTLQLRSLGLSFGALPFILYLGKHPGCSHSELTNALRMDWGHSQRSINRLEEGGFLTREKEGRSYRLQLTESGQRAFALSHQVFHDWDQQTLQALTQGEQQQLLNLLGKLAVPREEHRHV